MTAGHGIRRFEVRPLERQLLADGQPVPLGARAFDLLLALVERSGRIASKQELLDAAWPGLFVEENNLTVQIGTLRKLLGAAAIATIPGRGYQLAVGVTVATSKVDIRQDTSTTLAQSDEGSTPLATHGPVGYLPLQTTSLIGREREVAEVAAGLESLRLINLVGTGGLGKTRVMLAAAGAAADRFPDGVWFIDLAPVASPGSVLSVIARTLGVTEDSSHPLLQTLCEYAASRRLLMLLDNCEHVLDACAEFSAALLRCGRAPQMLATSREPLNIDGEQVFPLPALALPETDATVDEIGRAAAVRLFVERARQHEPQFVPTELQMRGIARLCVRLEGIPLALELAAARIRVLSVAQMLDKLDDRFALLANHRRGSPARHQTLRATIDWSYDLLTASEQSLLCRLSLFAGGWTLDAAQQVCAGHGGDRHAVFEDLAQLVNKSLVVSEQRGGEIRYRLLESIHDYALERLRQSAEERAVRQEHLEFFMRLAEEAELKIPTADQRIWFDLLATEHDNIRAALNWVLSTQSSLECGLRLAGALRRFWSIRGFAREGRELLDRLLAVPSDAAATSARSKALSVAGVLAYEQSEYEAARTLYERSLVIRRDLGDWQGIANSLNNLANVRLAQGELESARQAHEESLAIRRELGDRAGIAISLTNLGIACAELGEFDAAESFYREALAIQRDLGDPLAVAVVLDHLGTLAEDRCDFISAYALSEEALATMQAVGDRPGVCSALNNLGCAAARLGDFKAAQAFQRQSLAIAVDVGKKVAAAEALEGLAVVATAWGDADRAARLWGAAEHLRETIGVPLPQRRRVEFDRQVGLACALMGNERIFRLSWQFGRAMPLEAAAELALIH